MNTTHTHRASALRPARAVAALTALLVFGSATVQAGDSTRIDLLAAAESSPVIKASYRHDHRGDRHGNRNHPHRRGNDRHDPYGYGRHYDGYHDRHHNRHHNRHNDRHDRRHGRSHFGHPIRERAHFYASTAVRQAQEARALGFYSDHPRWRTGYHRHYRWALDASPHRIEKEIRRRARKLRELRSWGRGWPAGPGYPYGPHAHH